MRSEGKCHEATADEEMRDVYLFFSGQASTCMVRGEGGRGEEHHVHEQLPQDQESDAGQRIYDVVGEREEVHHEAEDNGCATNDIDGSTKLTTMKP